MLQAFYNYIVQDLIMGYFKKNPLKKGSRYYLLIENKDHCDRLITAIQEVSEPITISGVFSETDEGPEEEPYTTRVIRTKTSSVGLIIGFEKEATEDYLTTLRNSVGVAGGKYEDYAVLFILTDSVLSSLISSCKNMTDTGLPLNSRYIIEDIKQSAEEKLTRHLEHFYLNRHLEKLDAYIQDGACDLFDFQYALSSLMENTIKHNFGDMEYFEDSMIYDDSFRRSDKEMEERVIQNREAFIKISNIMNDDDEDERFAHLNKFLDEKLAEQLSGMTGDEWRGIDLKDIIASRKKKQENDNLLPPDVTLVDEGLMRRMLMQCKGGKYKKKHNIIICDRSGEVEAKLKLVFNRTIKELVERKDYCRISGQNALISVGGAFIHWTAGKNDNRHDFRILKLDAGIDFFQPVAHCFSLDARGKIVIDVPEDVTELVFGPKEGEPVCLPQDNTIYWAEGMSLRVPVVDEDGSGKKVFSVYFGDKKVQVTLKHAKAIPPVGPESFPRSSVFTGVASPESPFWKITDGAQELAIHTHWRPYLEWEHEFVCNRFTNIEVETNSITGKERNIGNKLPLPASVASALDRIYTYFEEKNTVPSLCPFNASLMHLYERYCAAVNETINHIPTDRPMRAEEYNLTRLGTVARDSKVYLSPFHPLIAAYFLEYARQSMSADDNLDFAAPARELLSPFYLMPHICIQSQPMRPFKIMKPKNLQNWLCYEQAGSKPQEWTNNHTARMVQEKLNEFRDHFKYLFQSVDSPIIICGIGLQDDTSIVKGIFEFIGKNCQTGVQRVELHMYVGNIMQETFFEKLDRLGTTDAVLRELQENSIGVEAIGDCPPEEIVRLFFTRVSFYKHVQGDSVGYCHIAFYQIHEDEHFVPRSMEGFRPELSLHGLISTPSTLNDGDSYVIGFGTENIPENLEGYIYPMAISMNRLYLNEQQGGKGAFNRTNCLAKIYRFENTTLLQSLYDNANWVTFLNPEVDLDFFYKQENLYIVHYTDQYTINAKYDAITVTRHVKQYENILKAPYEKYANADTALYKKFCSTLIKYFNCLNGRWLLGLVHKTQDQIREKMSIVAACITMLRFMKRNKGVIWVPVSLEEILRVTGSIGLPMEYVFSKKSLGGKGEFSDDLLMIGLDDTNKANLKLYLYPIEVKFSKNQPQTYKGSRQVWHTYSELKDRLFGEPDFKKNIFRTFFATQFLTNAEKLHANALLDDADYARINLCRYDLLNLRYTMGSALPAKEAGNAAVVSFYGSANHSITKFVMEGVSICEIHFPEDECFQFVSNPEHSPLDFLECGDITDTASGEDADSEAAGEGSTARTQEDAATPAEEPAVVETVVEDALTPSQPEPPLEKPIPPVRKEQAAPATPATPTGIRITVGHTRQSNRPFIFEPNNTKAVSHPNMGIIGTMGTGKTQFARSVIAQFADGRADNVGGRPVGVLVFDYKGDYKDKEFLDRVQGCCYKTNYPFNPLKLIRNGEEEGMNLPAITADCISDSFAKAYSLGLKQQSTIKQIIVKTYADAGITKDPSTWDKPVPTMDDVIENYFAECDDNDKVYALFDKLRDYSIFTSDTTSCVSLFEWLDQVRVIDLTPYPDDTKKVIVSLILDLFYAEMRQLGASRQTAGLRELRAMIMVDEAHQFLKRDFNSFRKIISEGRMSGVGMILSTQSIGDFKTAKEDYTQFVLSWVIHHVNSISKQEIASIFGTNDPNCDKYMDFINRAPIFMSLCKIGSRVEGIRDLPFFELDSLSHS